ncbi:uncharacterized protein LOC123321400 [Coccinella septempunctata]|uniref:uncharacterized protein LOC123321400 n=1 Tax=Coccinella septempunctata TaxID=41139 RepID=UPI001D05EF7E|nr:uncharacterized protein LOC123321400 [Coccinella septempunctata]
MYTKRTALFFLVAMTIATVHSASVATQLEVKDQKQTSLIEKLPFSMANIAALGAGVFVVTAGITAFLSLPLLAEKLCFAFGIFCLNPFSEFDGYRSINLSDRNKRSLEYVEPILAMLMKAYDTYADDGLKKKSKVPKF